MALHSLGTVNPPRELVTLQCQSQQVFSMAEDTVFWNQLILRQKIYLKYSNLPFCSLSPRSSPFASSKSWWYPGVSVACLFCSMTVASGGACLCEDVDERYERCPGSLPREMSLLKVVENIIICFTDGNLRGTEMKWFACDYTSCLWQRQKNAPFFNILD